MISRYYPHNTDQTIKYIQHDDPDNTKQVQPCDNGLNSFVPFSSDGNPWGHVTWTECSFLARSDFCVLIFTRFNGLRCVTVVSIVSKELQLVRFHQVSLSTHPLPVQPFTVWQLILSLSSSFCCWCQATVATLVDMASVITVVMVAVRLRKAVDFTAVTREWAGMTMLQPHLSTVMRRLLLPRAGYVGFHKFLPV
jgi:hypothetical protein